MDRPLVEQAQQGDREAFTALAFELSDRLFALAHRILRDYDAAGDALQVALLRIWRDLPSLHDPSRIEAWSYKVLLRACHDSLRTSRRTPGNLRLLPGDMVADDSSQHVANREELERAFRTLPVEQRAVIVLQYYRGLTLSEIAEALDVPIGTVRSRVHYAKRTLRSAIEADARPTISEMRTR
jgi:RNA polymerase sigma factor (sigma-70 family)